MTEPTDTVVNALREYRVTAPAAFPPPPLPAGRRLVGASQLLQVLAVAAAVMVVGVGTIAMVGGDHPTQPITPGSPSATAEQDPAPPPLPNPPDVFAGVDWRNATLRLPAAPVANGCPTGTVRLADGVYRGDRSALRVTLPYGASGGIRYGDLTGDGQPEAVLTVGCDDGYYRGPTRVGAESGATAQSVAPDSSSAIAVVARQGSDLVVIDLLTAGSDADVVQPRDFLVADGALKIADWPAGFDRLTPPVRTTYRWQGSRMVATTSPPTARSLRNDRLLLPALVDQDGTTACAGGEARFTGDPMNPPTATIAGTTYTADAGFAAMSRRLAESYSIDLDGDDILELVVSMTCGGPTGGERKGLYVVRQEADRFVVMDVPFADSRGTGWSPLLDYTSPQDGVLRLRLRSGVVDLRWDGIRFPGRIGLYRW